MKARKIKFICHAARWFDKVNGNTYHSVRIERVRDGKVIAKGTEYGYGEQYRQTALVLMANAKWLPAKYCGTGDWHRYNMDNNYPIQWEVTDGLKRDMVANGEY